MMSNMFVFNGVGRHKNQNPGNSGIKSPKVGIGVEPTHPMLGENPEFAWILFWRPACVQSFGLPSVASRWFGN